MVFAVLLGWLRPWRLFVDANGVLVVLVLTLVLIGLSELVHGVAWRLTKSDGLEDKVNEDYRAAP